MSDERAFVISTADTDWAVSIATGASKTAAGNGGKAAQMDVRLHRLDVASAACTSVLHQQNTLLKGVSKLTPHAVKTCISE